jgi:isochorismate synthase
MTVDLDEAPATSLAPADRDSLLDAVGRGVEHARLTRRPTLVTWTKPWPLTDPVGVWGRARAATARSMFWRSAWGGGALLAFGSAHDLSGYGEDRVAAVRAQWAALSQAPVIAGAAAESRDPGGRPLAVGGFAFGATGESASGGLPDALMWVPALQLRSGNTGSVPGFAELRLNAVVVEGDDVESTVRRMERFAGLCLSHGAGAGDPRDPAGESPRLRTTAVEVPTAESWKALVRRATTSMGDGLFEKVVLARELRVTASTAFDVPAAVRRMYATYPPTTVFALDHEGFTFLGATPEYLVRVEDRTVRALGLAGTLPRGATPGEDEALGRELMQSPKLRREHDIVVRMLREALAESCAEVSDDTVPAVVKLANVQHLSTPVQGRLKPGADAGILGLVERLHPTPALGGHPRADALRWLAANEGFDRSWYAGVVGWADGTGEGEFAVAIRSALVEGASASLYAGCGLVADSEPEAEYAETCQKLRPMLAALGIE